MSIVILDGFEKDNTITEVLKELLEENNKYHSYFVLRDLNIQPCRSCGACGHKSPGKCIIKDDIHDIMKAIARCNIYMMLTPIRYGGYSSQLKKALDRTMPLGMPFYIVRKGHMLHPMRYGQKPIIAVGLADQELTGQNENFNKLVAANALNILTSYHKALIFKPDDQAADIKEQLKNTLMEVYSHE